MVHPTIAEVEEKYANLEDYLHDYVDMLAYNTKRRLMFFYYVRNHGILLPGEDIYGDFPSYSKWRVYWMWKTNLSSFSS